VSDFPAVKLGASQFQACGLYNRRSILNKEKGEAVCGDRFASAITRP
jgi:hypothetical protein